MDRTEKDSLGEKKVNANAYYGIHTQRALENFKFSSLKFQQEFIDAICLVKIACAKSNLELGLLDKQIADAIIKAADEVITGKFSNHLLMDIFQAGSGTSFNMNVNEVIANRATELLGGRKGEYLVHPNDHVNMGESTNNIIPTAIRVSSVIYYGKLSSAIDNLVGSLKEKSKEFASVLKSGRTHLQDAVPITLGQEFNAYATAVSKSGERIKDSKKYILSLGIGGNAVGTGINTGPKFRSLIVKNLNSLTKENFTVTKDGIESTQFLTDIAHLSSALKLLAIDINKISNDLRLMCSGPNTGFNEIIVPAISAGSSIMPGKINPFICEATNMACMKVMGNDHTITLACNAGQLDLNTHMPVVAYTMIESLEIMTNTCNVLADKCIKGIKSNKEQCEYYVNNSAALATALNPYIGYDLASYFVKKSLKEKRSIKDVVLESGIINKEDLDKILDVKRLTTPHGVDIKLAEKIKPRCKEFKEKL